MRIENIFIKFLHFMSYKKALSKKLYSGLVKKNVSSKVKKKPFGMIFIFFLPQKHVIPLIM
jgi:hypothetical protein